MIWFDKQSSNLGEVLWLVGKKRMLNFQGKKFLIPEKNPKKSIIQI